MDNAGFKIRIAVIGILILMLIMPACAEDISDNIPVTSTLVIIDNIPITSPLVVIDNVPVTSDLVTITAIPTVDVTTLDTPVEGSNPDPESAMSEMIAATNSTDYLKLQWEISNFTKIEEGYYSFWIINRKAPDIMLPNIRLQDYDNGETIAFTYTKKTKTDGSETASIWNLFGFLNPESKISKDEMCQVIYQSSPTNLSVIYGDVTKTRWGIDS